MNTEKNLPAEENSEEGSKSLEIHQGQYYAGPLPPPEVLKKFDDVVPGAAERIIKMAESQFAHRTTLERKVVEADIRRAKSGQHLGFVIAITGLACAVIISIYGNKVGGAVLGVGTLASLVGVFMYGSRVQNKEFEEKN